MKLKGREKYFWKKYFNASSVESIPTELDGIKGIDSDHDDEFFFFLSKRVSSVRSIHLRCTNVTDEGVKHISHFKGLKELTLKDHGGITKDCLTDIDKLHELEYLDISKNKILVDDIYLLTHLPQLKHLHISLDMLGPGDTEIPDRLRTHFPGCEITMY